MVGHALNRCFRRSLSSNQFAGASPSMIAQLTTLNYLYVVVWIGLAFAHVAQFGLLSQGFAQQPIHWYNLVDDWTIDGAHLLVSRRVAR